MVRVVVPIVRKISPLDYQCADLRVGKLRLRVVLLLILHNRSLTYVRRGSERPYATKVTVIQHGGNDANAHQ